MSFSRRKFLKGAAWVTGAAAGLRVAGPIREARAAEPPALFIIHLQGGYNALFSSADSLVGNFGVTAEDVADLGNGLAVHGPTLGQLPEFAKQHMATIGVRHNISDHEAAIGALYMEGARNRGLMLANAMGGDAAIKAAYIGSELPESPTAYPAEGSVTKQTIRDMGATISAIGGASAPDPNKPAREISALAIERAKTMSASALSTNRQSLLTLDEGYAGASALFKRTTKPFSFADLSDAYGLNNETKVEDFNSVVAAAELMITAGANTVIAYEPFDWDTHGVPDGSTDRQLMSERILGPLGKFVERMVADPNRNVVVALMGDFSRNLDAEHANSLSATVIGRYVKVGSTGKVTLADGKVGLAQGTPGIKEYWAYLGAALKLPANPFGANPHNLIT